MSKTSFIHLRPRTAAGIPNSGGSTIAFREIPGGVEYAQAWCSPRDNFSRAVGRVKAEGRLKSPAYRQVEKMTFDEFRQQVYDGQIVLLP
jgi:hypothetical protein